jgi:hypothetical protein
MLIDASEMRVPPRALLFDPEFYVFDFDPKRNLTRFLIVAEEHLHQAPFIDIRFEPLAKASFAVPSAALVTLENLHREQRPRTAFIFHHAFVCSTLLARCLGESAAFFSLKEPWILRRLADTRRDPGLKIHDREWKPLLLTHLALLARNYRSGKTPVIKATNVANNLFADVLRLLPDHRKLYLYSNLESFLVSNLKKLEETRRKMPELAKSFIREEDFAQRFPQFCDIGQLSFLQVCALVRAASLYNFQVNADRYRSLNVRTLDMDVFLARPADTVCALARFFGHEPGADELAAMVGPGVMGSNAKEPQLGYDRETRRLEADRIAVSNRAEINFALTWAEPLERQLGLPEGMQSRQLVLDEPRDQGPATS